MRTPPAAIIVFFNEDLHFALEMISHSVDWVCPALPSAATAAIHHAVTI